MASRKRSRDHSDVDGEVEIESASSSFRQSGNTKRSRVTLARERGGSVVSDDEEEVSGYPEQDEIDDTPAPLPTFDHAERDDDTLEFQATQWVTKQMREFTENTASEQGVIEEVYCRNFMCHSKLRIKLGPLINFIIGHNGSGKSAVLTALTMCLGGKASATNRGASLKSLIKEGEESATLSVKIKNQGDGAFKRHEYGESIIVERNFTRSGTSGFKLKSAQDKIISTKKADLDEILDFFAFQLDNPINVLTQDMARQFLSNSSASDKYKFFIRGTQLEVLDADYKLMEEYLDSIEAKLHSREEDIEVLHKRAEEAKRKKERADRTVSILQRIETLQRQHAWAQVEEQEEILDRYRNNAQQAAQVIQDKDEERQAAEGVYEGHNQSYEAAQRMVQDLQEQLRPLTDSRDKEKEVFDGVRDQLVEKKSEERIITANVKSSKNSYQKLEKDIRDERTRLAEAEGPEHAERLQDLEDLKTAVESKQQEQADHQSGSDDLKRAKDEALKDYEQGERRHDQAQEASSTAERNLKSLEQNQNRQYAPYRPNMERLVKAIEQETRWRTKPVGPMGRHIRITKPEWTSQVEKTLGGNMEAFIVTNNEDQALLSGIMRRVNCQPSILITGDVQLDTADKEPVENVDTILRILQVDSNMVRNSLIINQAAEQIVLIPDRNRAHAFLYDGERPRNVKAVLAFTGRDNASAVRFEFSGRGAEKSSNVPAWRGLSRMSTNLEDQKRAHQESCARAKRDLHESSENLRVLRNAHEKAKQAIVRFDRKTKELKTQLQEADDAVESKQAEIESHRPQDGKLQELERQLSQAKDDHTAHEQSFVDMENAKAGLISAQTENKKRMDAAQKELEKGEERVKKEEKRLETAEAARLRALRELNLAVEEVEGAQRERVDLEGKAEVQQGVVDGFVGQAEAVCRRIPIDAGMNVKAIDERIEKFIKERQRAEQEAGGTREDLLLGWHKAKNDFEEAKAQSQGMQNLAKTLSESLTFRQQRWELFRRLISARARATFKYLLSERQFRGRVFMDHSEKLLDIKVEPDLSKASDAGRATKTLSGGEKSFSTICLLLSIWEAMGSPIRCLDEFDVFMDNVNRATSMTMMIQAARRSVGRQFILITPQAMNNVEMGDDVKVHKMSDPERGQTTLPFA